MARTSSVVQAIQLGANSAEGVLLSLCFWEGSWRIGISGIPTLKRGRRRSGGMLSTGRRESSEDGMEERIERS